MSSYCLPIFSQARSHTMINRTDAQSVGQDSEDHPLECAATRRILIVDDNVDAAETLGILLRLVGHEVQIAYDGTAAVQSAREFQPESRNVVMGMAVRGFRL